MNNIPNFNFSEEVEKALSTGQPVLALESTIISHGMPYPQNLEFAKRAEALARTNGAAPATIAILNGEVCIGLDEEQLEILAGGKDIRKTAVRDLASVISRKENGAATVSATMRLAHLAGIKVFATGGIGGVHRSGESTLDFSQDLRELGRTPVIVVSAGVKAILDIPRTLEYLETEAVAVAGFRTNEFPAFYSRESGSKVALRVESAEEIKYIYEAGDALELPAALLVANPVPEEDEIPAEQIKGYIDSALEECELLGIKGKEVTPFLLGRIAELTGGKSLKTNISLALNNVRVGAEIARSFIE